MPSRRSACHRADGEQDALLNRVVLELLAGEDETLVFWLASTNLGLDAFDPVIWINIERGVLSRQCLRKDLHKKL